jgi:hypothetical protein
MRSLLLLFLLSISTPAFADTALLLFGGRDHKTFLGCLNCGQYDSSSVWNEYGQYGSPYQSTSIWNSYGPWGSEYSSDSPWNSYASSAPAIVDAQGHFYGYFSSNQYIGNRTTIKWIIWLLDNHEWLQDHLDEARGKFG